MNLLQYEGSCRAYIKDATREIDWEELRKTR